MSKIFKVDTSLIIPSEKVQDYRHMCTLLDIDYLQDTRSKNKQFEHIKECLDIEKVKKTRKYIIHAIKKEFTVIKDGRNKGNNSTYNKYAPELLLDHICYYEKGETQDNLKTVKMTNKDIMEVVGFCNSEYMKKAYVDTLIKHRKITRLDAQLFHLRHGPKCKEVIKSTLKQSQTIMHELSYKEVYEIDDEGDKRISTDEEITIIKETEIKIMNSMGIKNKFTLYINNKHNKFYGEHLPKALLDEQGWVTTSKFYLIQFPDVEANKNGEFKLEIAYKKVLIAGINKLMNDFLNKDAENIYRRAVKEKNIIQNDDGDNYNDDLSKTQAYSSSEGRLTKIRPDYVEKQKFLAKELVNIETSSST